jgi:hypothetical protein
MPNEDGARLHSTRNVERLPATDSVGSKEQDMKVDVKGNTKGMRIIRRDTCLKNLGLAPFIAIMGMMAGSVFGYQKIDGTTGAPMGGVGSGAIKYCSWRGSFALADNTIDNINFSAVPGMRFQFYSNRGGSVQTADTLKVPPVNGVYDDDAIYPIQTVNFGTRNGIAVSLLAFSPIDFTNIDNMCYPMAMYELTLVNTQNSAVDASVALLLPTNGTPSAVAGKGILSTAARGRAAYVTTDAASPMMSYGNDNGFFIGGACNNALVNSLNRVAMKITLGANETRHINFVIAWYNSESLWDRFYYVNLCQNAGGAADKGLGLFPTYRKNAVSIVTAMRGSNLPDWLVNQTENTLSLLTNNTVYMKDGRLLYEEGQWNCEGTMDQQWAARFINYQMFPKIAWQELEFWARTQRTAPDTADGQIHHDMGSGGSAPICGFDQTVHPDGSFGANAEWVDLNCCYIVSVYENFIATDDHVKLDYHWPHVKRAAQRIVKQLTYLDDRTYPYTFSDASRNTYDVDGTYPFYNTTLASLAFKTMTLFAEFKSETAIKTQFDSLYRLSTASFEKRWLSNNFPSGIHCENLATGQWMAFFLGFGEMYPTNKITYMLDRMKAHYNPETAGLGFPGGSYQGWAPYLVSHYGGLCVQTGRFTEWKGLQQDWFNRDFLNRNLVFNIQLGVDPKVTSQLYPATDIGGQNQYMSIPVIWRTYYDLIGFRRNAHTQELALEPKPLPEMNHAVTNAVVFIPEGTVTINYTENGPSFLTQNISCAASSPIAVSRLYVRDKYASAINTVKVNGVTVTYSRVGSGFAKELCLDWSGTIGPEGIRIVVSDEAVNTLSAAAQVHGKSASARTFLFTGNTFLLPENYRGKEVQISVHDLSGRFYGKLTVDKKRSGGKIDSKAPNGVYIGRINK